MSTKAQRKATRAHRRRAAARGLVRVEVQAPAGDAALIKSVAATLRGPSQRAAALRSALTKSLSGTQVKSAFDIFGSDLSDEVFEGVFDQPRPRQWRDVEL